MSKTLKKFFFVFFKVRFVLKNILVKVVPLNLRRNFSDGTQKFNVNEIFINSLCTSTLRVVQQEAGGERGGGGGCTNKRQ